MPLLSQYGGVDREAVWVALFTYLQSTMGGFFQTIGRKHVMPPELPMEAQPALFVVQVKEHRSGSGKGQPNNLMLSGFLIVYLIAPVTDEAPGQESQLVATQLNMIFKALDDAFAPDNPTTGKFTLGGLVTSCFIEGEVDQDPAIFQNQAAAILPIHILVP